MPSKRDDICQRNELAAALRYLSLLAYSGNTSQAKGLRSIAAFCPAHSLVGDEVHLLGVGPNL
ncbi:hypothetical protein OAG68_01260 [bacterium]|nr:hypothetical protein [bacterium]